MTRISVFLLTCALALSGVAAYYSIVGLATIFGSAFWPVVLMSSVLEVSKLVVASWLYHNWDRTPLLIRSYLTSAVVILMMITSLGIFGFLSKAHVDQGLANQSVRLKIEQIDTQITSRQGVIQRYESQLAQLDRSINIQLDANRAQGALAARRQQEAERKAIRDKLDAEQATLLELNSERTSLRQQTTQLESKLGPIRYVAEFFSNGKEVDMESSVRWMILVIVLVFDPLAVLMIIAANMSLVKKDDQDLQNGPHVGDIRWDAQQSAFVWFNGTQWLGINLPQPPAVETAPFDPTLIPPAVKDGMNRWLEENMSVVSSVDPETIRSTVEQTVKSILEDRLAPPAPTPSASATQSPEPEVPAPEPTPIPKPPLHQGINQKS